MASTPQQPTATASATDSSSSSTYEGALTKLQPLRPILRGLNHRNKNQHRRAAWWGAFGLLRRHVDSLVDELARAEGGKKKRTRKRKRDDEKGKEGEGEAKKHARWLRDRLVPRCYLAFSQLTADNQWATLGVVLLGALAQVHAVCVMLVGDAQAASSPPPASVLATGGEAAFPSALAGGVAAPDVTTGPPPSQGGGGAVVSRDEVARAEKLRKTTPKPGPMRSFGRSQQGGKDDDSSSGGVSKPQQKNASVASTEKAESEKGTKAKVAAKKKKKPKRGDEFDDLFKGLF
ncbi:hypothetical protein F4779DRAFT_562786 [Xylariaceae sp. FL0662B]|nr:hypothetical protein F4779DRAFT_562786 [Xylariaceae sp. FL0662B]